MNIRKFGILGLMAVMGVFLYCSLVEAAVETVRAYRAYDNGLGPIDEAAVFGTNYNSVYVIATCTGMTGGTCTGTASAPGGRIYVFTLSDDGFFPDIRANDGVYTGFRASADAKAFTISRFTTGAADLLVGNGQSFSVSVDIDGLNGPGAVNLMAEYIAPGFAILPYVTKTSMPLDGTTSICFTAKDDVPDGTWTYEITIDNKLLSGNSTGTCSGQTAINMIWDGRDKNGDIFSSGNHNINVKIADEVGNDIAATVTVMLDTVSPQLIGSINVTPYSYFSTDTGKKSVTISFKASDNAETWAYSLSYNGELLAGTGASGTRTAPQTISFVWNGRYGTGTLLAPGQYEIVLKLWDSVGNITIEKVYITIDNTAPVMENLQFSSNFASSASPLEILFTGVEVTGAWTYEITISGQVPGGTSGLSPSGTGFLSQSILFIWPAIDKNGSPFAEGDHLIEITLTDQAGNVRKATSSVNVDGTPPSLTNLTVSNTYFSPFGSPSTNNISFTGSDNIGTWAYGIYIDGVLLDGIPSSAGILGSAGTISFAWNGKNVQGSYLSSGVATITVQLKDMAGNTTIGSTTVTIDTIVPEIISASVSEQSFSLEGDKRSTTIAFTATDVDMWRYALMVDGTVLSGTGTAGTFTGTATVRFVWDGYVNGTLTIDGIHTFTITVMDRMGNSAIKNFFITVDCIQPNINWIKENASGTVKYIDEEILFYLEADSSGEAAVLLTSQEIQGAEDVMKGEEYIRMNDGWRQFEGDIIGGTISIYVANGLNGTWTSFAITDNYVEKGFTVQRLIDDINKIAFATSTYGSMTYDNNTDRFTIRAASGYSIGLREYCYEDNRAPFFTSAKLFCGYVPLYPIGGNVYQGKYLVPQTSGTVTCRAVGLFKDNGGNKAVNYGTSSRIVSLNGQKKMAYENVKIIGLRVEPDPLTQVFNTMNKRVTFNMIAGEIDSEIKGAAFGHQDGTITISSPEIKAGDNIIVWNDGLGKGMKHGHVWKITAGSNDSVSITNASLCFGEGLSSYGTDTLRDDYFHVSKGVILRRGMSSISMDIGSIENNILLYDDGNNMAHHDRFEGDGIFSGFYELPDGLELSDVPVFAHIRVTNEKFISNDGYPFNDGESLPFSSSHLVADTKLLNNIYIDMDTIRPQVTLLGSTVPFNPEAGKKCEIKYTLTKTLMADVRVVIKDGYKPGANIVKDLGIQTAKTGDNVCYWQGDSENGELVPDASYYYFIYAADKAGNKADEIFGVTKVSRVLVDLVEVKVTSAKTITGNAGEGSTYVNIDIDCMLKGNQAQLENLDFDISNQSTSVWNRPHALFHIAFFDKDSKLVFIAPDDWDNDIDSDPFPKGLPNYVQKGEGTIEYRGNTYLTDQCIHLGNPWLIDKWDGNKGNDFDTLVPFNRVLPTDNNAKEYHAKCSHAVNFKSCGIKLNPGTYFVRIYVELMAAGWKFIDHEKSMSGDYIAEKWHCLPDFSHYGLATEYKDYRFEIVGSDLPSVDNKSPDVYESSPCDKAEVRQKEIKSGEKNKGQGVWVRVGDQGLGVDFSMSKIMLLGPNGLEVSGSPMSNGNDKLYWVIDDVKYPEGLSLPGEYTIKITVYDKAKNLTEVMRRFTVIDEMPPEVKIDITPDRDIYEGQPLTLGGSVSEYNTGGSDVDQGRSAIILKDGRKEIPVTVKIQETDKRYIGLSVELPNGLPAGTYTVSVIGYDISGNKAVIEKSFIVLKGISVLFHHPQLGTVTCMNIIPGSRIYYNGTSTEIGTNTLSVRQLSTVGTFAAGFASFGVPIEIFVGTVSIKDCKIDKDVILRLYYTNAEVQSLSGRVVENDIGLHEFTGSEWKQIIGETVDPMGNQVSYQIAANIPIMGSYAISYPITGDITLRMEWENDASTIWMIVPGSATANGVPAAGCTRTVTAMGTASIPAAPEGYKILSPVVAFSFNNAVIVSFSENVQIKMHYNPSKLPTGVSEGDLVVYGYSGGKWNPLTQKGDAGKIEINTIILTTNATCQMYAIMYRSPEIIIPEQKAAAGFKESAHCYPNPARGKVAFAYNLTLKSKIIVKVYTMLGDIVWEDTRTQDSGVDRNSSWNCCNNTGEKVASGVYFYRLTMEPEDGSAAATVTKKLIVVQ
ncbi:MAG: T9SS type A sorting domain-containing protein [bacterium]|nr:T9SS type A sorting domain-containing protein [bacterium]